MYPKKPIIILVGLLLISTTIVVGIDLPNVPVTLNAVDGTTTYFDITLSNVPAGNDVTDGLYPGWCADFGINMPRHTPVLVTLYDSYDPTLPTRAQDGDWDKVNWILNNKDSYSMMDIQYAIWNLLNEVTIPAGHPDAQTLVANAVDGFTYEPGDILAIVCVPQNASIQCSFIELIIPPEGGSCRWTGGGTIGTKRDPRVTHGFELHCNVAQLPNNLEVNWGGDHFHLDVLTQVECSDDPAINPRPPQACCDTIHGWGDGKYNGASGYKVEFIFTDAGEPGRVDWAWIKITDSSQKTVMEVSGFLKSGNQQAHCLTGIDAR